MGDREREREILHEAYSKKTVTYNGAQTSTKGFIAPKAKQKVLLLLLKK